MNGLIVSSERGDVWEKERKGRRVEGRKEGRKGRESSLSVGCPWGIGEMSDGFIQPHVAISSGLASE